MGQVVPFKYGELDQDTSGFLRETAGRIQVRLMRSSQDIIEIGQDLREVKSRIGHGNFLPWISAEFDMSEDTAERYIAVANKFGTQLEVGKIRTVRNLSSTALYELTKIDAPPFAEVEQMSQNGEAVTTATIKELRAKNKKLREQRDIARTEKEGTEAFIEGATSRLHDATCEVQYLTNEIERITKDNTVEARVIHDDDPLRQALMGFWRQLPQETQEWFLNEVVK